jgi:tRNA dimethylallyltransferase
LGIGYLQQKLEILDPYVLQNLVWGKSYQTLQNPQRMMRFVEVCFSSGKPYSSFKSKENSRNFTSYF